MKDKDKQIKHYLNIIDDIEKVRTRNNMNWMDVLRLAFKHSPEEAKNVSKVSMKLKTSTVVRSKQIDGLEQN